MSIPSLRFMDLLGDAERELISTCAVRKTYEDQDLIHDLGQALPGMSIVVEGMVKLSTLGAGGQDILFALMQPGQNFGDIISLWRDATIYRTTAVGRTVIDYINEEGFRKLRAQPGVSDALYLVASQRLVSTMEFLADARRLPPAARVGKTLEALAGFSQTFGRIELAQSDIASFLGFSSVTIAKSLAELKGMALIKTGYRFIEITDIVRLRAWLKVMEEG